MYIFSEISCNELEINYYLFLEELINIKVILILIHELFR